MNLWNCIGSSGWRIIVSSGLEPAAQRRFTATPKSQPSDLNPRVSEQRRGCDPGLLSFMIAGKESSKETRLFVPLSLYGLYKLLKNNQCNVCIIRNIIIPLTIQFKGCCKAEIIPSNLIWIMPSKG